ncbi:MAG TPA: amidohydrolase family protein, partial [Anaerolineales bacterium]
MKILIKGGTLVTAERSKIADLLIDGEKIQQVAQNLPAMDSDVIDATGKLVLPGGVDPHVHLDLPMFGTVSSDDHYTGTKAAAFGGTTTVIDFISFDYPTFRESVDAWQVKAKKAAVDYSAHMNLTRFNDTIAAELPSLPGMGITTVKTFTAYNGRLRLDDGSIFKALRIARDNGMLVMLHAENGDVIDLLVAEALA